MAQLRLTKKGLFVLVFILSFVFFSIGFGIWQLAGPKTFQPTDSSAGSTGTVTGCTCSNYTNTPGKTCDGTYQEVTCDGKNTCGYVVCGGYQRLQCCNGRWVVEKPPAGVNIPKWRDDVCAGFGGYNNCTGTTAQKCYCKSYVGCGVDCVFPAGTQAKVDAKAKGTCSQYIAMCNRDTAGRTTISIEKFTPSHKCWGQEDVCKNPVGGEECVTTNTCEGGGLGAPANNAEYKVGDVVRITGYAYDKDGIDKTKIVIKVNGKVVGNATAKDFSCPVGSTDAKCVKAKGSPVVTWSYNYTIPKTGNYTLSATWYDTKGVTGASCQGSRSITTTAVNVCEGGAITQPAGQTTQYEVGQIVQLAGYAYDKNGINKNVIQVWVNGTKVGLATATDHACPTGSTDDACVAANGSPVVDWTYNYTITAKGTLTIEVKWWDTTGLTGNSCKDDRTITATISGQPFWTITKSGGAVCIDETSGSQKSRLDYTITVKNVGDLGGQLDTLVDVLDSKVETSYIQASTIDPDASVSGHTITWDLGGSSGYVSPQESLTFKYSVIIPESAFGRYTNTATLTPESGSSINATENVDTVCSETPPEEIPNTGLFDSIVAKVMLGVILIGVSAYYLYTDKEILKFNGRVKRSAKEEFERRVVAGK